MLLIMFLSLLCITVQEETADKSTQEEKTFEKNQKLSDLCIHFKNLSLQTGTIA
jgi:hypothetical protein